MKAIVVGSQGQDGTLLSRYLASRGYQLTQIDQGLGPSIADAEAIRNLISETKPEEVYYLAAFHHSSEEKALLEEDLLARSKAVHVEGLTRFLEAIRTGSPDTRLFYASSSHVLTQTSTAYAQTKKLGMQQCGLYREKHGVFASVGILYNHESPLRLEKFLSKKIVRAAIRIANGDTTPLVLGNLSARVDWGWAEDFVEAMYLILQAQTSDDFVIGTGETHSVQDFVEGVFSQVGLDWKKYVREDRSLLARQEQAPAADISKIVRELGWKPKTSFHEMIRLLVEAERKGAAGASRCGDGCQ